MRAYACVLASCAGGVLRGVLASCVRGVGGLFAAIGTSHAVLMSPLAAMARCWLTCVAGLCAEVASSPTSSSINPRSPRHIEHGRGLHTASVGPVFARSQRFLCYPLRLMT
jgi:hypothetical protein